MFLRLAEFLQHSSCQIYSFLIQKFSFYTFISLDDFILLSNESGPVRPCICRFDPTAYADNIILVRVVVVTVVL